MSWLQTVVLDALEIAWDNRVWMGWNTFLAVLPALLAPLLFRRRERWGRLWGLGLVVFLLFLPNAPYVVTDLVHLRGDVVRADTDAAVYAGVLPLYLAFIAVGFGCYAVCLREVGAWMREVGWARWIGPTEIGIHVLAAVGVLLGRVARLNSWDTVAQPQGTLERALETFTWRGSPFAIVALFGVIWAGHAVTRVLVVAFKTWLDRHRPRLLGSAAT